MPYRCSVWLLKMDMCPCEAESLLGRVSESVQLVEVKLGGGEVSVDTVH